MKDPRKICLSCMKDKTRSGPCQYCGFDPAQADPHPQAIPMGSILEKRFIIGRVVETGGDGITYIGYDNETDKVIRIREYFPDGLCTRLKNGKVSPVEGREYDYNDGLISFLKLYNKLATLSYVPAVLTTVKVTEELGTAFSITEAVEDGITLRRWLVQNGGLATFEETKPIFTTIVSSLSSLHREGIIHSGISPETIMIDSFGRPFLIGFSITDSRTEGTAFPAQLYPGYAAPEQYNSNEHQGPWTDVYGLCAVIYRSLEGSPPTEASERNNYDLVPPEISREHAPDELIELVNRGLALSSRYRLQSAEQLSSIAKMDYKSINATDNITIPDDEEDVSDAPKKGLPTPAIIGIAAGATLIIIIIFICFLVFGSKSSDKAVSSSSSAVSSAISSKLTSSAESYKIPDFLGQSYDEVINNSTYHYLTFKAEYDHSSKYDTGKIMAQSIKANTETQKGTTIILTVSMGPETVSIPNVIGMTSEAAKSALSAKGFTSVQVYNTYDETAKPNVIISMKPDSGETISPNDSVTLYFNTYTGETSSTSASSSESSSSEVSSAE